MPVLVLLYGMLPALQVAAYLMTSPFYDGWDLVNLIASIVCYGWMLANVLVSTKLPVLQRSLPYDARIRFHILGTLGITATLLFHTVYKLVIGKFIDVVSWSLLALFGLLLLLSLLWIPLPGFRRLREVVVGVLRFSAVVGYDALKRVHSWVFLSLAALMYVHVLQTDTFTAVPDWSSALYTGQLAAAVGLYAWSKLRMWGMARWSVSAVREEGGIVHLTLTGPRPRYRAGQFAFLRFQDEVLGGEEHPFSFLSAPHESELRFAIRARGDFTKSLAALRTGTKVMVNGGYGAFHPRGRRPVCLIANGAGTVPFISLLRDWGVRSGPSEVLCLFAVDGDTGLPGEWEHARTSGFDIRVFPSAESRRFDPEFFAHELGDASKFDYYICSSPQVTALVRSALQSLGVRGRHIRTEQFALG